MKQFIFILLACACTTPQQDTGNSEPEYNITLLHGELAPTSGCYVIYYDKPTYEIHVELNAIEEKGTNFCLTEEYHD